MVAAFPLSFPRQSGREHPEPKLGDAGTPSHDCDVQAYMKTKSQQFSVEKDEKERLMLLPADDISHLQLALIA